MLNGLRTCLSGTRLRKMLGIRLGVFHQYAARPVSTEVATDADTGSDCDLPSITIVTPSLNQGTFIGATVASVLGQSYPVLQYVIQDGGSTDTTLDVLRQFPAHAIELYSERDSGQADALNKGFARARGTIHAYLNADDILLGGALQTVGRFFRDHPEVDVVYGNRLIIDEAGQEVGRWLLPGHMPSLLRHVDYVPQETLFWRASAVPSPGQPFDAKMQFALDWAFLLRLMEGGARFAHLPLLLGGFRVHAEQKTQAQFVSRGRSEMAQLRKHYAASTLTRFAGWAAHAVFLARHWMVERRYTRRTGR